jgi:hypothetical protein
MKEVKTDVAHARPMNKMGYIYLAIKELTRVSDQTSIIHLSKSTLVKIGEIVIFFILIPAVFFYMLCHVEANEIYLIAKGQKLALTASAEDFLRQFPDGDISYQLKFAVDFVRDGSISAWVLNLWPPGMPGLNILIIGLTGTSYYTLKMMSLSALLYAFASYLVYRSLGCGRFSPAAMLACALPMLYMSFQKSIFVNLQIFSTDYYCFMLLAVLLSLLFNDDAVSFRRLALMAIVLAALAYFRSFYFIFIKLLTVWSMLALAGWCGWGILTRCCKTTLRKVVQSKLVMSLGVLLLITWALMLPWIIVLKIEDRPFDWTVTDQAWAAQWRNDLPSFLVGLNTPCIIEKDVCEQLMPFQYADTWAPPKLGSDFYKRLSIVTFVSHPLKWYGEKAKWFEHFWFDDYGIIQNRTVSKLTRYVQSAGYLQSFGLLVVSLFLALSAVVRCANNISHRRPLLENNGFYFLFLLFFTYNVMVFTFVHFEPRYSIPLKLATFLFLMFLLRDTMSKIDLVLLANKAERVV